jgi:hypothetical protein
MRRLRCSEPSDGVYGFPLGLARMTALTEPRVPIGDLGFTEDYALLDVGENVQKGTSMHACALQTTSISRALKRAPRATDEKKAPTQASAGLSLSDHEQCSDAGPIHAMGPLGCGVTVTDWRLYTAYRRQRDQNTE